MLTINDLSLRVAGRLLLDHASLSLPEGAKAGLVGRNGTGKTTLFRAITGDLSSETGSISLPRNTRIGEVAQEAPGTQEPLIDIVLAADTERAALLAEEKTATDPERIADIHIRLADIDAHSAEARAATILAGLGFRRRGAEAARSSFSGGWRMRVALAAVLFAARTCCCSTSRPTISTSKARSGWRTTSRDYPHTVLLISHDRDLLNRAVNSIVHLDQKKLTFWRGGYDQFERQRSRATRAAGERPNQAGGAAQASADLRRPLPRQGVEGAPGAVAHQGAGKDEADRGRARRHRAAVPFSRTAEDGRLADHRAGRARRRLPGRQARS